MIHIIGTRHSLQIWTPAKRHGESLDATKEAVERFECYLADAARALKAEVIAEEASEEWIEAHGEGASSVAKDVAGKLDVQHIFCDANTTERRSLGLMAEEELLNHAMAVWVRTGGEFQDVYAEELKKQTPIREAFWLGRLKECGPDDRSIVFVCGADHVDTFKVLLEAQNISASILRRDWEEGA
jgi:hypothetical protein